MHIYCTITCVCINIGGLSCVCTYVVYVYVHTCTCTLLQSHVHVHVYVQQLHRHSKRLAQSTRLGTGHYWVQLNCLDEIARSKVSLLSGTTPKCQCHLGTKRDGNTANARHGDPHVLLHWLYRVSKINNTGGFNVVSRNNESHYHTLLELHYWGHPW